MRVQYIAARSLMRGASSAGEATTTERAIPFSPRICSMNSFTSRPRSPTSPTIVISASVKRVIMPSNILLPTPLPAKRPRRWPRPTVNKLLIERMPTSSGSSIGWRLSGLITGPLRSTQSSALKLPLPSSGRPMPSTTRPSIADPIGSFPPPLEGTTRAPGCRPSRRSTGIR